MIGQTPKVISVLTLTLISYALGLQSNSGPKETEPTTITKINCEVLYDDLGFELRWVLDGDDIIMQLVGRVDPGEFMALGLGKNDNVSAMINSDAMITWIDPVNNKGYAVDYHLGDKAPCTSAGSASIQAPSSARVRGSCPDVVHSGATDSVTLLHSSIVNGFSMVTFKRPQLGVDPVYDQHIYSDGKQSIIWSIGPVSDSKQIMYHRLHSKGDNFIDFARVPSWNCPPPDNDAATTPTPVPIESINSVHNSARTSTLAPPIIIVNNQPSVSFTPNIDHHRQGQPLAAEVAASSDRSSVKSDAWEIPQVVCPKDRLFRAQIGPTGGRKGYQSITGKTGWGIAWYINGLLIPELVVERGKTYTFLIEGGNDPVISSRRHPFYITDDPEGGYDYRTDEERSKQNIYAGAKLINDKNVEVHEWAATTRIVPTAEGRLCEWMPTTLSSNPDQYGDFFTFQRTLNLQCLPGQPGVIRWTPDKETPDTLYYHCWTHRNLGWKIKVVDNCDQVSSGSSLSPRTPASSNSRSSNSIMKNDKLVNNQRTPAIVTLTKPLKLNSNHDLTRNPKQKKKRNNGHQTSGQNQVPKKKNNNSTPIPSTEVIKNNRDRPVQYQFQPHLDAWMYQPPSWTFEANIPSDMTSSDNPDMTLEPFFVPSYPLPPISSDREPVFIRQKLPDPIPIPRDKNTGLPASRSGPMMSSGFVPMKLKNGNNQTPASESGTNVPKSDINDRMTELKLNISRYGFPFLDTSVRKKKLQKLKNLPPEPYISPSTMSASISNTTPDKKKNTNKLTTRQPESYMNIRVQNLHHYPGNSVTYKIDHMMVTTPSSLLSSSTLSSANTDKVTTVRAVDKKKTTTQTPRWAPNVQRESSVHSSVHSALSNHQGSTINNNKVLKKRKKLPGSQRIGSASSTSSNGNAYRVSNAGRVEISLSTKPSFSSASSPASPSSSTSFDQTRPSHSTRSVPSSVEFSSLIFDSDASHSVSEDNHYHHKKNDHNSNYHYDLERTPTTTTTQNTTPRTSSTPSFDATTPTIPSSSYLRYKNHRERHRNDDPKDENADNENSSAKKKKDESNDKKENDERLHDRNVIVKIVVPDEKSTPLYYSGSSASSSASPSTTTFTASPTYIPHSSYSSSSAATAKDDLTSSSTPAPTTLTSFSFPSTGTPRTTYSLSHSTSFASSSSAPSSSSTPNSSSSASTSSSPSTNSSPYVTLTTQTIPWNGSITLSVGPGVSVFPADDVNNLANHKITTITTSSGTLSSSSSSLPTTSTDYNHHSPSSTASKQTLTSPLSPIWTPSPTTTTTTTQSPSSPSSYLYYHHEDNDKSTTLSDQTLTNRRSSSDDKPKRLNALSSPKRRIHFDDQYLPIYSSSDLLRLSNLTSRLDAKNKIFDPSTLNESRTDHTILNHILSLIAVGETPPEVKIFTKPIASSPSIYSTHVEIHKELRARSKRSILSSFLSNILKRNQDNNHNIVRFSNGRPSR